MRRLFFALWPEAALRAELADAASVLTAGAAGRRVPAAMLHLTLVFAGAVAGDAQRALRQAASGVRGTRFELSLDRAGSFGRARVWWLGPSSVPEPLMRLAAELRSACIASGIALHDERFTPHVTVLRDARGPAPLAGFTPIRWAADSFSLVESRRDGGLHYVELQRWPLLPG